MNSNLYNSKQQVNLKQPSYKNTNNITGFKHKNYNGIFITLLSILYILFINKIAEMLTVNNESDDKISNYVMIVYFISIMGLVVAYVWMAEQNNGNYVVKKSLTYGGIIMLIYTVLNYWEYLDDYAKLIMLALSIVSIVYYAY